MSDWLLVFLIIVGALALYWIVWGQWKHNQEMREYELARIKSEFEAKKKK